ncbi:MAG: diguanylate cyclase [Syntrophales bacterium]|nr:diguanylate cyclase [Syntrophales bacterium]
MEKQIRILILEDTAADAEMMEEELREAGIAFLPKRVAAKQEYLHELDNFSPDLILSDYNLPQYDGASTLLAAKALSPDVPFILVTGALGEERAIDIFTHGANDYVMKGQLQRLVPAVQRALAEAAEIKARKTAEEALKRAHDELEIIVEKRTLELQKEIAERMLVEETVQKERSFLRKVIDTVPSTISVKDSRGRYLLVNEAMARFFGTTVERMVGKRDREFAITIAPEQAEHLPHEENRAGEKGMEMHAEARITGIDKRIHWFSTVSVPLADEDGVYDKELFVATEITKRKEAEDLLRRSEEKLRLALDAAEQGTWDWNILTDDLIWSERCKILYGIRPEVEMTRRKFLKAIHPDDRDRIVQAGKRAIEQKTDYDVELRVLWQNGTTHWIASKGRCFYDEGDRAVRMSGMAWDITLRKRYEEEIRTQSNTDELTGLFNRRGFLTLAEQELKRAERTKKGMLFIYVDLDDMKTINDTFGHRTGDEALVEAAGILREVFRESDIIARIGGDEFALLAAETPSAYTNLVKTRLQRRIAQHNVSTNRPYALSMSTGVAHFDPHRPISLDKLISIADLAMYAKKQHLKVRKGAATRNEPHPDSSASLADG